ncbi:MAG: threonine synthase [Anaerolineae bacterium]
MPDQPTLICETCGEPAPPLAWRCASCGGTLWLDALPAFDAEAIRTNEWSLWRYGAMLPITRRFSLGEGLTPLVPVNPGGVPFLAKLEYLNPTGSYKDRGVSVMMNYLLHHHAESVVEDSSGNAGASVAAYAGGIGLNCRIFVPAGAPEGKTRQIAQYGAEVVAVGGPRHAVTEACEQAAENAVYASHAWNPYFIAGQMTIAWETWEQMARRAPEAVVCPVGQGGLLLGWYYGYRALLAARAISHMPRLFAVQTEACAPIVDAWENGEETVTRRIEPGETIADGIRIGQPLRSRQILRALRETDGAAFRVDDLSIQAAQTALGKGGLYVEPTSAAAVAALPAVHAHLGKLSEIVVPLTGSGLKASR